MGSTENEYLRVDEQDLSLLERAKAHALDYVRTANARPVFPTPEAVAALAELRTPLPARPTAAREIVDLLHRVGSPATVTHGGGRYYGFVNGGIVPAARAAKWLADVWDQNAAKYVMSPVMSVLESVCEEWLVDLLGLPEGTVAGFVGGTSTATICGLAAARDELLRRQGWDAGERGLFGAPELRVVVGAQAHSTVYKALAIVGLGRARVVTVPADGQGRMLARKLPALDDRTIVVAQAGNVSSGAFDPLAEICEPARTAGAWVHVDGAFGLWAAASPRHRHLAAGAELADSWSADAHKTLNAPYDCGIIFCRDGGALTRAMHMSGSYIPPAEERDGMSYTLDMSRRGRAAELWATLLSLGREGVAELVDGLCAQAVRFAEELRGEGFTIHNQVVFNQVLVGCETPEVTRATLRHIQESGECWCGGAMWKEEPVIRISVCSYTTTAEDVRRSVAAFVAARAAGRKG